MHWTYHERAACGEDADHQFRELQLAKNREKHAKKFRCPEKGCRAAYTTERALQHHVENGNHEKKEKIACHLCGNLVLDNELNKHYQTRHQEVCEFICQYCGIGFFTLKSQTLHEGKCYKRNQVRVENHDSNDDNSRDNQALVTTNEHEIDIVKHELDEPESAGEQDDPLGDVPDFQTTPTGDPVACKDIKEDVDTKLFTV